VSWLGLRYFRSQIDCKKLDAAFARQVENIKEDAHKRLKIGTKKADVARFFAELSISLTISGSEAREPFGLLDAHRLAVAQIRL